MSKEGFTDFFNEVGDNVKQAFADAKATHEEDLRKEGREDQRQEDLIAVTELLLDLNTKDGRIYELLRKYFKVNSVDEIQEYLLNVKIKEKRKALSELFDTYEDYKEFARANHLTLLFKENPQLLDLPAEKLKKQLETK